MCGVRHPLILRAGARGQLRWSTTRGQHREDHSRRHESYRGGSQDPGRAQQPTGIGSGRIQLTGRSYKLQLDER